MSLAGVSLSPAHASASASRVATPGSHGGTGVKKPSRLGKTVSRAPSWACAGRGMEPMSLLSLGLLIAVAVLVVYLLVTLVFPEHF